ncbi:hypothetical protein XNC1_1614 [Xenorhabdus nematophila ATCC 19061]|uniref:Uncharacterized protein n=1 Tax=Xenorhabdus nematophila (strain ATCC 19061 / DSM 3370 / CCUG 14189 / LMG 1036 / NCIMB 9965 / AN6) TaxID=406817 RepID=D3VC24_XENNA|nr:hypothetical protein XNC1_1614 [Xenorhabdus nematophila ATCC 19061]CEE94222.1 hypothetical protein XNA1_4530004 [Xenorhabdus nematophila str. Anatoliense]CEE95755.1 hypothetical protein XNA1_650004 [Xenorhabdus nematophila str. Anatoliense]CEK22562.1 hypothetical protein XNC2_1568 [Xenorhabdus nematophila AN6/1]
MKSIDKIIKLKNSFVSYRKEFKDDLDNNQSPIVFLHGTNRKANRMERFNKRF